MIHGEEKTIETKVPSGAVYTKRVKYCAAHGWIDLFLFPGWEARHGKCNRVEHLEAIGLKLPKTMAKEA